MKKSIILLSVIVLSVLSFAQKPYRLDSVVDKYMLSPSINRTIRYIYEYDEYGNEVACIGSNDIAGEHHDAYYRSEYDANHRLISKTLLEWQDNQYLPSEIKYYTYDDFGNEIAVVTYAVQDGDTVLAVTSDYVYDDAGNKISSESYTYTNGKKEGRGKAEYVYDSASNVIVNIEYNWVNGDWKLNTKKEYQYTATSKKYTNYQWSESAGWRYIKQQITIYDDNGDMLADEYYERKNDQWAKLRKTEFEKVPERLYSRKTTYEALYGEWVRTAETIADVDELNRRVSTSLKWNKVGNVLSGSKMISKETPEQTYTASYTLRVADSTWICNSEQQTKCSISVNGGDTTAVYITSQMKESTWVITNRAKYVYFADNKKRRISEEIYEWNPVDASWILAAKTNYEYDKYDNTVRMKVFECANGKVSYVFEEEIWYYTYFDDADALDEIRPQGNQIGITNRTFNLIGQPVDDTYHGIVIQNGMKKLQ